MQLKNEGLIYLVQKPVYFLLNSKYVFTVQRPNHTQCIDMQSL